MKAYTRFAAVVTILALHSCSNGMEEGNNASSSNTIAAPPPTIQPQTVQPAQTSPQQTTSTTAAGLNPPHGQPGHRCDISVGAPLNSKPSTPTTVTTAAPQQQTVVMPQPTAPAAATTTAAGKNPPHGQPGHRCDIAVGAPLPK